MGAGAGREAAGFGAGFGELSRLALGFGALLRAGADSFGLDSGRDALAFGVVSVRGLLAECELSACVVPEWLGAEWLSAGLLAGRDSLCELDAGREALAGRSLLEVFVEEGRFSDGRFAAGWLSEGRFVAA